MKLIVVLFLSLPFVSCLNEKEEVIISSKTVYVNLLVDDPWPAELKSELQTAVTELTESEACWKTQNGKATTASTKSKLPCLSFELFKSDDQLKPYTNPATKLKLSLFFNDSDEANPIGFKVFKWDGKKTTRVHNTTISLRGRTAKDMIVSLLNK